MRSNSRASKIRRSWGGRLLATAGTVGLLLALAPPGVAVATGTTWVVKPGQSIQAAADKASSGDTIKIEAGKYYEAVCIEGKGLTIRGAGRDSTIILPPPTATANDCWVPGTPEGGTVENVSALKFLNPDRPVAVTDLQTNGHPEDGIVVWGAKGFTVKHTKGVGHGVYGILATAGSTNIVITDNIEQGATGPIGPVGTAGISVGDSANAKALIANNRSEGLHLGIFARESRTGTISNNTVRGNCIGILVFDDSATRSPVRPPNVIGGNWAVLTNRSVANNGYCIAGRDGSQHVSGVGMAIVNADKVLVSANTITDNHPVIPPGQDPVNFFPAGMAVLTFPMPPGQPGVDPGPAENVRVVGNIFKNNQPVDIQLFAPGSGDIFTRNLCGTSDPATIWTK